MEKRNFLFRFVPTSSRNKLLLDQEALYSTTDQLTADKISKDLLRILPETAVVTDATACIGGSAYSLSRVFHRVHAIEIDDTRFHYLQQNMKVLQTSNVECHHGDALKICQHLAQDLIFLDPPWGGPEYKTLPRVSLQLAGKDLSDVCIELSAYAKYIAVKVPVNFDEHTFLERCKSKLHMAHMNTTLRKMHLLVLEVRHPNDHTEQHSNREEEHPYAP